MKTLINASKKLYRYNCDRCGEQISFKANNLKQLYVKYDKNFNSKKVCDLCDKCFKSLERGVFKKMKTCTEKEQETCDVEKRGCEGCYYNKQSESED